MFTINISAGAVFALGVLAGVILSAIGLFVIAFMVYKKK
jgi:uncharacterized membrane protein